VDEIVTYLEMTGLQQLRPGRVAPGIVLKRIDRDSPLIPSTQARVGAAHGWESSSRSEKEWAEWLSHPRRQYYLIRHENEVAGIADLEPQPGGDVEVTTFGLLPEFVGRGLGGHALTLTVRTAWEIAPLGTEVVNRVWLHTSTLDHPGALPNYERRGFRPFKTRTRHHD
jgi:GNAT superfamily N-acetyltransferase